MTLRAAGPDIAGVASAQGQDVSNWQPVQSPSIWSRYHFGFAKATEGTTFKDATFAANWANMKAAGIHRGAYHFFHPALDPIAQANFFVGVVKAQGLEPGDMVVADVEITSGNAFTRFFQGFTKNKPRNNLTQQRVSIAVVDLSAKAFLDEVKRLVGSANPVLVYSDLNVGSLLTSCTGYPLWIAYYSSSGAAPTSVLPWKFWTIWQWGIVNGIDRDGFNGTNADMDVWIDSYVNPPVVGPPYRHTVTADTSLSSLAARRNLSVSTFLLRQATDMNATDAQETVWKAGSVYYTLNK
jgi:lysozyme